MERKLKHHENKLLRKTDFLVWKKEKNLREIQIIRRYRIQKREDYTKYASIHALLGDECNSRARVEWSSAPALPSPFRALQLSFLFLLAIAMFIYIDIIKSAT